MDFLIETPNFQFLDYVNVIRIIRNINETQWLGTSDLNKYRLFINKKWAKLSNLGMQVGSAHWYINTQQQILEWLTV